MLAFVGRQVDRAKTQGRANIVASQLAAFWRGHICLPREEGRFSQGGNRALRVAEPLRRGSRDKSVASRMVQRPREAATPPFSLGLFLALAHSFSAVARRCPSQRLRAAKEASLCDNAAAR